MVCARKQFKATIIARVKQRGTVGTMRVACVKLSISGSMNVQMRVFPTQHSKYRAERLQIDED